MGKQRSNNIKHRSSYIIIGSVLILVLIIVAFIFTREREERAANEIFLSRIETSVTSEERRVLARYRNEQYGFEIQYPDGLRPALSRQSDGSVHIMFSLKEDNENDLLDDSFWFDVRVESMTELPDIDEEYLETEYDSAIRSFDTVSVGELKFDGITFTTPSDDIRHTWIHRGDWLYKISGPQERSDLLSEIIATITFLE